MKKVLVTGGAGFIGSNLIKALSKEKLKIFSLDDYSSGTRENEIENVTYIEGDISSISQINEEIDICFHLAAKSLVQESFQNVRQSFTVNVDGTLNVLEWAKDNNVKILFAGSASRHNDPTSSPYAMTKFIGEETCKLYKKNFNVNVEIARFYNVYGPNERIDDKDGNVIGIWRSKLVKGLPLPIVGDGNQKRNHLYVDDAIDATITWLKNTKAGIFNIGGADTPTNLELISLINKKMSKKVQPIFVNQEQHDFIADISNMKKILKFTPRIKIKDGINKTVEKF